MREPLVSKALKIILYIIFVLGVLGTVTLPLMLDTYTGVLYDAYYLQPGYRGFIICFLMVAAVFGLWAVLEMILMLRSIPCDPFVARNVRALRRLGIILLILAALFIAKCLYYVTFLTLVCGLLFFVCGLFAFTLGSLFQQAVAYKEENDLTI